jgi:DNA mismatch repair protein MutS2
VKSKARTEAREVLSALRQKLREFARIAAPDRAEIKKTSGEVDALSRKLESGAEAVQAGQAVPIRDFHVGEIVRIERLNKTGTVVSSHGGILELEVGAKKIKLPAAEAVSAQRAVPLMPAPGWSAELREEEGAPDRLNIIGLRVPEGLAEVDRFIDRAGLHHFTVVTIIHGLGTGALKAAVTEFLRNHPLIASIRSGEPAEGGAGVTVAELKK